jgi:hypothetical protein
VRSMQTGAKPRRAFSAAAFHQSALRLDVSLPCLATPEEIRVWVVLALSSLLSPPSEEEAAGSRLVVLRFDHVGADAQPVRAQDR